MNLFIASDELATWNSASCNVGNTSYIAKCSSKFTVTFTMHTHNRNMQTYVYVRIFISD